MYYCLVNVSDGQIRNEIDSVINKFDNIEIKRFSFPYEITVNKQFLNCLLILITDINPMNLNTLNSIQAQAPDVPIVFYNHSLVVTNLNKIGDTSRLNMIVGENRIQSLFEMIKSSRESYWRRIPYSEFSIDYESLSYRIKKAMEFIENTEINHCNIDNISASLNISPGYFSQQFKRETGQSFRTFMQHLLNYYEDLILSRVNMPTKYIAEILGYSELSSFSRSFKNRKGISPKQYRKQIVQ